MAYYSTTDFNNDNYSYSDSESNSSEFKKQKKVLESMKRLDPDYFTVFRENKNPLKKKKWFKIELFKSSYNPKVRVRNAVTGIYESYKVGSNNSNIYFKVILATGETGPNPPHLYFDSPEQYEFHFKTIVPESVKETWLNKYNLEADRIRDESNHSRKTVIR
jgi:hypothetical protein